MLPAQLLEFPFSLIRLKLVLLQVVLPRRVYPFHIFLPELEYLQLSDLLFLFALQSEFFPFLLPYFGLDFLFDHFFGLLFQPFDLFSYSFLLSLHHLNPIFQLLFVLCGFGGVLFDIGVPVVD